MSVRVMTAAWAVDIAAGEKLVLLALADCANDEGKCWPGLPSLARKTGKSRRSLIDAIHALEKGGHLSRDIRIGKGVNYTIHPQDQAELPLAGGAKPAPVQKSHQCKNASESGAKSAPKPSGTVITKKGKPSSITRDKFPAPNGVEDHIWRDFLASPKRRKAGMSATAYAGIKNNLSNLAEHGYPPGEMIALAVERGWATVKLEWVQNDGQQRTNGMGRHQPSDGLSATTRAARDVFGLGASH